MHRSPVVNQGISREEIRFWITPRRIVQILSLVVLALAMAHVGVYLERRFYHLDYLKGLYRFFNLGQEANLPTLVSSFLLLGAGILILLIWVYERRQRSPFRWHWFVLGLGFVVMSIDEMAQIHEGIFGIMLGGLAGRGEGIWYYSWTKLFIPIVILIGLAYIPFLLKLPRKTAVLFLVAGGAFVGAAIGIEMVESYLTYAQLPGRTLTQLIEESIEMLSVVLLIYALLTYIAERHIAVHFGFANTR